VKRPQAGPDLLLLGGVVHVVRLAQMPEPLGEDRARDGDLDGVGGLGQLSVAHVGDDAPLLQRVLEHDHHSGDGVELPRCLEQHVAHEAVQVGLTRETLEVAANHRVGLGELGKALLGGMLALVAHVIHEPLAVQRGADHAGRGLERRELRGVDGAVLARVVESHDPHELPGHEDRHDRLGLGADSPEARCLAVSRVAGAEAHAAPRAQLGAHVREVALVAGAAQRILQMRCHPLGGPLAHYDEQRLAVRTGARLEQIHTVDVRGLADEAEHLRDHGARIDGLQEPATRPRRCRQEALAPLQRLVDAGQLFGAGKLVR